jgi:hypothetical protein
MSSENLGSGLINIDYQQEFTSEEYNKRMNKISKPGIYEGGTLEFVDPNLTLLPFVAEFRTSAGQNVRYQTTVNIVCNVSGVITDTNPIVPTYAKPYVVGNFSWSNTADNYADFSAKSAGELVDNDVIFGKVNFDSGGVFQNITYDEKTWGAYDQDGNSYVNSIVIQTNDTINSGAVADSGLVLTSDVESGNIVGYLNGAKIHVQFTMV